RAKKNKSGTESTYRPESPSLPITAEIGRAQQAT
ncbi:hypothetical protein PSYMO_38563, partial [Pseudomonas amygdali pv. mori str. 301020]